MSDQALIDRITYRTNKKTKEEFIQTCKDIGLMPTEVLRSFTVEFIHKHRDNR